MNQINGSDQCWWLRFMPHSLSTCMKCLPRHVRQGRCRPARCTAERPRVEVSGILSTLPYLMLADDRLVGRRRGPWSRLLVVHGDCKCGDRCAEVSVPEQLGQAPTASAGDGACNHYVTPACEPDRCLPRSKAGCMAPRTKHGNPEENCPTQILTSIGSRVSAATLCCSSGPSTHAVRLERPRATF